MSNPSDESGKEPNLCNDPPKGEVNDDLHVEDPKSSEEESREPSQERVTDLSGRKIWFVLLFFKDWHYLERIGGVYFDDEIESSNGKVVLEVGCGAGNMFFPLIATFPKLYVHVCDFSPNAIMPH